MNTYIYSVPSWGGLESSPPSSSSQQPAASGAGAPSNDSRPQSLLWCRIFEVGEDHRNQLVGYQSDWRHGRRLLGNVMCLRDLPRCTVVCAEKAGGRLSLQAWPTRLLCLSMSVGELEVPTRTYLPTISVLSLPRNISYHTA